MLAACLGLFGCTRHEPAKHYQLHGKVMAVDKRGHELIVEHDAIPGFMDAMTMPYPVADPAVLDKVAAGDEIQGDLRVQDQQLALEKVQILQKAAPGSVPVAKPMHVPEVGESVPNFELRNQNGKRIRLNDYRGRTLLLTFFYTRCPLNDYCPRVNGNFAAIDKQLASNPELYRRTHLLSISFDPKHDTPEVLRSYGAAYTERYTKEDFKHWEFASAPAEEMKKLADFFGVFYEPDGDRITHSLSTAVIGPEGKIEAWYPGNSWKPEELIAVVSVEPKATSERAGAANSPPAARQ